MFHDKQQHLEVLGIEKMRANTKRCLRRSVAGKWQQRVVILYSSLFLEKNRNACDVAQTNENDTQLMKLDEYQPCDRRDSSDAHTLTGWTLADSLGSEATAPPLAVSLVTPPPR